MKCFLFIYIILIIIPIDECFFAPIGFGKNIPIVKPVARISPPFRSLSSLTLAKKTQSDDDELIEALKNIDWENEYSDEEEEYEDYEDVDDEPEDDSHAGNKKRIAKKDLNDKEWMFFDVARINVKGGDGGKGCMAMRREYCVDMGGPSGGNGGNGGNVYFECDTNLNTLASLRTQVHYKGEDGNNGLGDSRHGRKGKDIIVKVPPGTIVRNEDGILAGELNNHGDRMLVAKGGRGGRGNEYFKTARYTAPSFAEKGEKGIDRWLFLELKLLADLGLVGVPNAGKSTFLAAVTNAKPKIADYPFTTVVPNLGVCDLFMEQQKNGEFSGSSIVLADIPGLLEGAHQGVGLGLAFLRHIQRCRVIVHMIKGDSEDPIGDYIAINQELELYNPYLLNKTQVIVINKIDMPDVKKKLPSLTKKLKKLAGHTRIMGISALTRENCRELMCRINNVLQTIPPQDYMELFTDEEERINFEDDDSITNRNSLVKKQTFQIIPDPDHRPNHWHILGKRIERIVAMTNWEYYESMLRFQRIMDVEGISKGLETAGVKQGDTVEVGSYCFTYWSKRNQWIAELGIEDSIPRLVKRAEREEEEEQLKKLKRKKDNKELKLVSETNVEDDED